MKLAIDILKNLLLPKLEKDSGFDSNKTNTPFWETFTAALLDFESDAKPIYEAIYSLELANAEKIIAKLPRIYSEFLKELAEGYVLGQRSDATEYLLQTNTTVFVQEVQFLQTMEQAIRSVERRRIKVDLPNSYERLTFELSETDLAHAAKKKGREDLREKMKQWGTELQEEENVLKMATASSEKETKVISLSWMKYVVAASLVLGIGLWVITNQNQGVVPENTVVTTPVKKDTTSKPTKTPEISSEALAEVTTVSKSSSVLSDLGYASNTVKIVENNQKARKLSIEKAIENYQQLLENEFAENKVGVSSRVKELESKKSSLQNELALLKEREKQYVFDGRVLVVYVSTTVKENSILLYEDSYYLKREADFYRLTVAVQPQLYKKERNSEVVNALDEILYKNGK